MSELKKDIEQRIKCGEQGPRVEGREMIDVKGQISGRRDQRARGREHITENRYEKTSIKGGEQRVDIIVKRVANRKQGLQER